MSYTPEQLAQIAGGDQYKQAPVGGQYFDTITLGKDGKFYLTHYSQPKESREDPTELQDNLSITILKIRRKLSQWDTTQHAFTLQSVEYDAGASTIPTTQGDMTEKDAKSRGAKVQLVLYALYDGSVVKMTVTGQSLYNPDDIYDLRLYSYLQSFDESEHLFMYETIVRAKARTFTDKDGLTQTGYDMVFTRGDAHTTIDVVGNAMVSLPAILEDNDARDLKFLGSTKPADTPQPTTAIQADDIPF